MNLKPQLGVQLNPSHPLVQGLVGCWLMNEGSGSKVCDLSGNGNSGIVTDLSWQAGDRGPVLYGGAVGDGVNCGNDLSLQNDSYTIICRVKRTTTTENQVYVSKSTWYGNNFYIHFNREADNRMVFNAGYGPSHVHVADTSFIDVWASYAISHNVGEWSEVYYDGNKVGDTGSTAAPTDQTKDLTFGINPGFAQYPCDGVNIDYVLYFTRALSASEIQSLYINPYQMFDREPIELWAAASPGSSGIPILRRRRESA